MTQCPVMAYLANAQFLGLEGLWRKLNEGKLPARCTKQWYFETFCGYDQGATHQTVDWASMDKDTRIKDYLNGFVKP